MKWLLIYSLVAACCYCLTGRVNDEFSEFDNQLANMCTTFPFSRTRNTSCHSLKVYRLSSSVQDICIYLVVQKAKKNWRLANKNHLSNVDYDGLGIDSEQQQWKQGNQTP